MKEEKKVRGKERRKKRGKEERNEGEIKPIDIRSLYQSSKDEPLAVPGPTWNLS